MESTEKQDVVDELLERGAQGEMGLLTEGAEAHGDVRKSERYWSVKTHYPNIDRLFNGFKSGDLVGIGGKHAVGKAL